MKVTRRKQNTARQKPTFKTWYCSEPNDVFLSHTSIISERRTSVTFFSRNEPSISGVTMETSSSRTIFRNPEQTLNSFEEQKIKTAFFLGKQKKKKETVFTSESFPVSLSCNSKMREKSSALLFCSFKKAAISSTFCKARFKPETKKIFVFLKKSDLFKQIEPARSGWSGGVTFTNSLSNNEYLGILCTGIIKKSIKYLSATRGSLRCSIIQERKSFFYGPQSDSQKKRRRFFSPPSTCESGKIFPCSYWHTAHNLENTSQTARTRKTKSSCLGPSGPWDSLFLDH